MKIRMLESISGGRADGRAWPPYGGEIEVPGAEGRDLCAAQLAVPVADTDAGTEIPEAAADAAVETRQEPAGAADEPAPGVPPPYASKAVWVEHAVGQGMPRKDAEAATKADLVSRFGG